MESLKYKIALMLVPNVGSINGKKLVAYCGGVEAIFKEKKHVLMKIPGIGKAVVQALKQRTTMERVEQEMDFIERNKITPLFFLDSGYPKRLKHCIDGPLMLFYKGRCDLNASKVLAVVGTRRPTDCGKNTCKQFVQALADPGLVIVSGMAYGIDSVAHRVALDSNMDSIGVLAHGLDIIYPAQNRELAGRMLEQGGLLTEFFSNTNPDRENFPKRNRIVAGMSDAVLVVESAERGGALITADIANSYNRDVFAIPGRLTDEYSVGCNYLIKSNKAALVQTAEDIRYLMGWDEKPDSQKGRQQRMLFDLSREEELVMEVLKQHESLNIDQIFNLVQLGTSELSSVLLNLEFKGAVRSLPGKIYRLN
jgi:DNA processing protein